MLRHFSIQIFLSVSLLLSVSAIFAADNKPWQADKPGAGELVVPGDYDTGSEKKCLTVCERWGEDCIVNPSTGGRKCRRVCKHVTEECFLPTEKPAY